MFYKHIVLKELGTFIDVVIGNSKDNVEFCKKKYKKTDPAEIKDIVKFIQDNAGGTLDLTQDSGARAWLFFVNEDDCGDKVNKTIDHEMVHVISGINDHYLIHSEEFVAYWLSYYTDYIIGEYKKMKEKSCLKSE